MIMEKKWYAVYTKPRWEKKVSELLNRKKVNNYCPLNKVLRQWHDRKKVVYEPVFTSYVFVQVDAADLYELKKTDGIINLVHWLGKPAIIRDKEIDAIKSFLGEYEHVQLEREEVRMNDAVRILYGPLASIEGNIVEVTNNHVKLILPSLGYSMVAQVRRSDVQKIFVMNHQPSPKASTHYN